jgi:hypothetical protein
MFSGSGEVIISLQPISEDKVAGLLWTWLGDFGRLSWGAYPGALCYSIYKLVDEEDPFSEYVIVAECVTDLFLSNLVPGTYIVTAITPNGETVPSDQIVGEDETPVPVDPCDPDPGEELGPVPTSFGLQESTTVLSIPVPNPHLDFNVPYVYTRVDFGTSVPPGDGWQLELTRLGGELTASDGSTIYSMFGLQTFINGSPNGFREATCASVDYDQGAMEAAVDGGGYTFQEVEIIAGDTIGLGFNLRNVSWGDGQLGAAAPTDDPFFDPTQACAALGGDDFSGANSATIASNLQMNLRIWRDLTPAVLTAQVKDFAAFKAALTNPPQFVSGLFGPETYRFETVPGDEWDGKFHCGTGGFDFYELEPDDCFGYPIHFDLLINGYEKSGLWVRWQESYYGADGSLINDPAWLMMIYTEDLNWGAEFVWWAGVKLTGTTPLGTYLVWPRDPYNFNGGDPWPNADQTELFAAGLPCVKLISL